MHAYYNIIRYKDIKNESEYPADANKETSF